MGRDGRVEGGVEMDRREGVIVTKTFECSRNC